MALKQFLVKASCWFGDLRNSVEQNFPRKIFHLEQHNVRSVPWNTRYQNADYAPIDIVQYPAQGDMPDANEKGKDAFINSERMYEPDIGAVKNPHIEMLRNLDDSQNVRCQAAMRHGYILGND